MPPFTPNGAIDSVDWICNETEQHLGIWDDVSNRGLFLSDQSSPLDPRRITRRGNGSCLF